MTSLPQALQAVDVLNQIASEARLACTAARDMPGQWTGVPKRHIARLELLLEALDAKLAKVRRAEELAKFDHLAPEPPIIVRIAGGEDDPASE